jgi:hypothetical protein
MINMSYKETYISSTVKGEIFQILGIVFEKTCNVHEIEEQTPSKDVKVIGKLAATVLLPS